MTHSHLSSPRAGKGSASFFLLLFVSVIAGLFGYGLASAFFPRDAVFALSASDPYAGCHLAVEFIQRIAVLCRPFLITAVLLLFFSYSKFSKTLFSLFFAFHAIAVGVSVFLIQHMNVAAPVYLPALYAAVIAVYLIFTCCLHTKSGVRPFSEAIVFALIASGAAGLIFTFISFIFRQSVIL